MTLLKKLKKKKSVRITFGGKIVNMNVVMVMIVTEIVIELGKGDLEVVKNMDHEM